MESGCLEKDAITAGMVAYRQIHCHSLISFTVKRESIPSFCPVFHTIASYKNMSHVRFSIEEGLIAATCCPLSTR